MTPFAFFHVLFSSYANLWLVLAAILALLELTLAPNIGFLFASLAAGTLGMLLSYALIPLDFTFVQQIALFAALTMAWGVVVGIPISCLVAYKRSKQFAYLIGAEATAIGSGLSKGKKGKIYWEGMVFPAEILKESDVTFIPAGRQVKVIRIQHAVAGVAPVENQI